MHSLTSHFILGYHGCDKEDGERILNGEDFTFTRNDYDWLGHGVYFWENNPSRGFQFAQEKQKRRPDKIKEPFVIGAVIDLGFCLDMTTHNAIAAIKASYNLLPSFLEDGEETPQNKLGPDFILRHLDCQVIEFLHHLREINNQNEFDSVRGIFTEGERIYENAGFYEKTHTQIAIRNESCIKEVFRVRQF
jgi:hypothetical protein